MDAVLRKQNAKPRLGTPQDFAAFVAAARNGRMSLPRQVSETMSGTQPIAHVCYWPKADILTVFG